VEDVIAVVVGFLLTTVAGGWWASRLQQRAWLRQNEVQLRQAEHEIAAGACKEITSLLDRRLYRMQRLVWAAAGGDLDELERRRQQYVAVLFDWNDHLNTNLSVVGTYFGNKARGQLDGLYEDFKRVGRDVEDLVRGVTSGEPNPGLADRVGAELEGRDAGSLNDSVYQFGLLLMGRLRDGKVGRKAPDREPYA